MQLIPGKLFVVAVLACALLLGCVSTVSTVQAPADSCPQFTGLQLEYSNDGIAIVRVSQYSDLAVHNTPVDGYLLHNPLYHGIYTNIVECHQGNGQGENSNYFYCDGVDANYPDSTQLIAEKTLNESGKIQVLSKAVTLVFDASSRQFVKTVCG